MADKQFYLTNLKRPLRKYLQRLVHDQWLVDDLLQESLLIVHLKHSTLQDKSKLLPWSKTIARNLYLKHLKQSHIDEDYDETYDIDNETYDQTEIIFQNQKAKIIYQLLNKLPENQKILAIDYYSNGLKRKEICIKYGITTAVFDSRLLRARNKIKSYLLRRHKKEKDIDFINRFNELIKGEYSMDDFRIEISQELVPELTQKDHNILDYIKSQRTRMAEDFHITLPKVHIIDNKFLKRNEYIILLNEKQVSNGELTTSDSLLEMTHVISGVINNHFN